MLQYRMISSDEELSTSPSRRTPREEEQYLCNEALRTGDFDSISDSEWIALCERVASKGRSLSPEEALDNSIALR